MTSPPPKISEQTRAWFFERDARGYPALSDFCVAAARRAGAGPDAEDLAQSLLLDLLRLRDRGALKLDSTLELERYVGASLRRRRISLWNRHGRRRVEGPVEEMAGDADAPDAAMRGEEHIALCVQIIRHALECVGARTAVLAIVERIFNRYVHGRDVESMLIQSGLLSAEATAEQREQERNNENRRQSRARGTVSDALHELAGQAAGSAAGCWLEAGGRRIPFNFEDVQGALRFAMGLARSERPRDRKGQR